MFFLNLKTNYELGTTFLIDYKIFRIRIEYLRTVGRRGDGAGSKGLAGLKNLKSYYIIRKNTKVICKHPLIKYV